MNPESTAATPGQATSHPNPKTINDLPNEILGRIFIITCELTHQRITNHRGMTMLHGPDPYSWSSYQPSTPVLKPNAHILKEVCERWKEIISDSVHLWYIPVGMQIQRDSYNQAESQLALLQTRILDSDSASLADSQATESPPKLKPENCDIYAWFCVQIQDCDITSTQKNSDDIAPAAQALFDAHHFLARHKSRLSVLVGLYCPFIYRHIAKFLPVFSHGCPRLEWLSLHHTRYSNDRGLGRFLPDWTSYLPSIPPTRRTLFCLPSLYHLNVTFSGFHDSVSLPAGPSVEEAKFHSAGVVRDPFNWSLLSDFLKRSTNLKKLELKIDFMEFSSPDDGRISNSKYPLGSLEALKLHLVPLAFVCLLREFEFPALSELDIDIHEKGSPLPESTRAAEFRSMKDKRIIFPSVTQLSFLSVSESGSKIMKYCVFPCLQKLQLQDCYEYLRQTPSVPLPISFSSSPKVIVFEVVHMARVVLQAAALDLSNTERLEFRMLDDEVGIPGWDIPSSDGCIPHHFDREGRTQPAFPLLSEVASDEMDYINDFQVAVLFSHSIFVENIRIDARRGTPLAGPIIR